MKSYSLQPDIIYGPVDSRRLGKSLGINLMPSEYKLCSMNCCYCQYGWTTAMPVSADVHQFRLPSHEYILRKIQAGIKGQTGVNYLTIAGNGEPTLHPDFAQIIDGLIDLKNKYLPDVKIALLTNGTTCSNSIIIDAINKIDLPIIKLDAGTEQCFREINHPGRDVNLIDIINGIKNIKKYFIQTMFVSGSVNNSSEHEVNAWIGRLQQLRPQMVQVYSIARSPASCSVEAIPHDRLLEIASLLETKTGLRAEVA